MSLLTDPGIPGSIRTLPFDFSLVENYSTGTYELDVSVCVSFDHVLPFVVFKERPLHSADTTGQESLPKVSMAMYLVHSNFFPTNIGL